MINCIDVNMYTCKYLETEIIKLNIVLLNYKYTTAYFKCNALITTQNVRLFVKKVIK